MRLVSAEDIARVLTDADLIVALAEAFRADIAVPMRHHHTIPQAGGDATLLLMPAWTGTGRTTETDAFLGCKLVTVFPANAAAGLPSVQGSYLLLSGTTGEPLAAMDGRALTVRRTAAASALAASYLAREDSSHLVMVGAGALAPYLVRAHVAVRPITRVTLWNRTRARAVSTAFAINAMGIEAMVADDLEAAVRDADIVSCATLSEKPLIQGKWLRPGTHLDLVGGFTPKMREADDAAVKKARIYVDTRAGAMKEAGDIVAPIRRNVIARDAVIGDLFDLCRRTEKGRRRAKDVTLFKSVGTALEDLAAAVLVWRMLQAE